MVTVTVSGIYRADRGHQHGEPHTHDYSVSFDVPKDTTHGDIIVMAAKKVRLLDSEFDSLKTHHISKVLKASPKSADKDEDLGV